MRTIKNHIFSYLFLFLAAEMITGNLIAQEETGGCNGIVIDFCDSLDAKGNLINESHFFTLPASGGYITIVVHPGNETILEKGNMMIQVCRLDMKAQGNKAICVAPLQRQFAGGESRLFARIKFKEAGDYSVSVYPEDYSWSCSAKLIVTIK